MYLRGTSRRLGQYKAIPPTELLGLQTYANSGLGCACDGRPTRKQLAAIQKQFSGLGYNYSAPLTVDMAMDDDVKSDSNIYNLPGLTNGPVYPTNTTYPPQTQSLLNAASSPGSSLALQTVAQQLAQTGGVVSVASPAIASSSSSLSPTLILAGGGALLLVAILASKRR